jgi:hypothetical protein
MRSVRGASAGHLVLQIKETVMSVPPPDLSLRQLHSMVKATRLVQVLMAAVIALSTGAVLHLSVNHDTLGCAWWCPVLASVAGVCVFNAAGVMRHATRFYRALLAEIASKLERLP